MYNTNKILFFVFFFFFITEEYKSFRLECIHVLYLSHDWRVPHTNCCGLCNQSPRIDVLCIGTWHVRAEFSPVRTYCTRKSLFSHKIRHTHRGTQKSKKKNTTSHNTTPTKNKNEDRYPDFVSFFNITTVTILVKKKTKKDFAQKCNKREPH